MKLGTKKAIVCMLLINYIIAASCPNMCSGHGSCGKGGICSCFPGWLEGDCSARSCPYGHGYVDPTTTPGGNVEDRASLECSGQGTCDRTAGTCKCFPGYEGVSCDRLSCPNNCNGHGVCTPVKMLDLNEDSHSGSYYETDLSRLPTKAVNNINPPANSYKGWDLEQSHVCVCDGEYRGFDCSEKKCPTGYVENSDCDSPAKSTQTITIGDGSVEFYDAAGNPNPKYSCMAYLEYTDTYGRIWYSDAFCVLCDKQGDPTKVDPDKTVCDNVLGWNDVIGRLPVGTIDATVEVKLLDDNGAANAEAAKQVVATVNFGAQQTGKQTPMRIITKEQLTGANKVGAEWCGDCGSGYHGMTTSELTLAGDDIKVDNKVVEYLPYTSTNPADIIEGVVDGIPPLECSRNGVCQRDTGLCSCFEGYYGNACTEQASML